MLITRDNLRLSKEKEHNSCLYLPNKLQIVGSARFWVTPEGAWHLSSYMTHDRSRITTRSFVRCLQSSVSVTGDSGQFLT